jgi:hypothetical protein
MVRFHGILLPLRQESSASGRYYRINTVKDVIRGEEIWYPLQESNPESLRDLGNSSGSNQSDPSENPE